MTSEGWADRLVRALIAKHIISFEDKEQQGDIRAEAQVLFEDAMQEAAEGGVL
jgi:hypothetical protein